MATASKDLPPPLALPDSASSPTGRPNSRPVSLPVHALTKPLPQQSVVPVQPAEPSGDENSQLDSPSTMSAESPKSIDISWFENNEQKVITVQKIARRRLLQPHFNLLLKLHRKRTRVAREIWHSETTYLEGLMTLLTLFKLPLMARSKLPPDQAVLPADQITIMFNNVEQLIDTSKKLLKQLQEVVLKWTPHTRVGHIFMKNTEMLKEAFTPYVDHFDKSNELFIKQKQENKKFQEFLANVEYKQCDLGLESYLIMPIQRVARYGLLLREYIKQTWQDHDDFADLTSALQAVDDVARYVNEHKTKMVNFERVKVIQSQIVSMTEDLTANQERQYILEGAVTEMGKIPITHYLFLFNDVLVWTQQVNKKKYLFRKLNWLARSTAEAGELNSVKIVTDGWETKIFTKSKEEQNKWIAYIENENYTPINEVPHPLRPSVVFLERRRMIQSQLNLAAQAKGASVGGSRRASQKRQPSTSSQPGGSSSSPSGEEGSSSSSSPAASPGGTKLYHRKAKTIDMQELQKDMEKQVKKMEKKKDKQAKGKSSDRSSPRERPATTAFKAITLAPQDLSADLLAQLRKLRPAEGATAGEAVPATSPVSIVPSHSTSEVPTGTSPRQVKSPRATIAITGLDPAKDDNGSSERRTMPRSITDISGAETNAALKPSGSSTRVRSTSHSTRHQSDIKSTKKSSSGHSSSTRSPREESKESSGSSSKRSSTKERRVARSTSESAKTNALDNAIDSSKGTTAATDGKSEPTPAPSLPMPSTPPPPLPVASPPPLAPTTNPPQ